MLRRSSEYKTMVWKNGGGVTKEIDRSPTDEEEEFHWRLSMATVRYPGGPFSIYENIDRTLAVIEGKSLKLMQNDTDQSVYLNEYSAPYSFKGETSIVCQISEDTLTDFNVMTRRDKYRHLVERRVLTPAQPPLMISNEYDEILFIVVAKGKLDINHVILENKDTMKFVDYHQTIHISPVAHGESLFYIVRILKYSTKT